MNKIKQNIRTQFYLGDTVKDAELNLLDLHPNISLSEIKEEFKLLVSKELKKAKSNKLSLEVINGNSFFRYQLDKREFFINSKNSKEIFFDRAEVISTLGENSIINNAGQINIIKMIDSSPTIRSQILAEIEKYLRKYIALKNEEDFIVLATYIVLTYVFSSFQAIPYLRIKGNKGTGKTTILKILENLVNNPYMVSNISPASLYRITKDGSKTLLLDEAENLAKRGASNDMRFEILNSGYKKGGKVSRVYKDDIIEYSTFGPKIIAGINELAPTTEDRCIIIETDSESTGIVKPYLDTPDQKKELESLKLKLFYQSPTLLQDILIELSSNNNFCEDIRNRNRERWLPLLLIVKLLSGKMEKIMTAAKRDIDQKSDVEKSSPESIAISTMIGYISNQEDNCISKSSKYICFEASTISTVIKEADVYRKFSNQGQITKFLKTVDVLVDRVRVKGIPKTIYKIPIPLLTKTYTRSEVKSTTNQDK